MPEAQQVETMNATWFVYSEDGKTIGRIRRKAEDAVPDVGGIIEDGKGFDSAEVLSFQELSPTCMMRRYKVVVRVIG
jgi:hypothetical protein